MGFQLVLVDSLLFDLLELKKLYSKFPEKHKNFKTVLKIKYFLIKFKIFIYFCF